MSVKIMSKSAFEGERRATASDGLMIGREGDEDEDGDGGCRKEKG